MKKLLSLLLALAMVFTLAACGGGSKDSKKDKDEEEEGGIAGKYLLTSAEKDGEEMSKEDMEEDYGDDSYIEIEEDGTAELKLDGEKMDMEWEDDEIWVADDEDEKFGLDINEKKGIVTITIEEKDEVVLTFEKEASEDDEDDDKDNDKDDDKDDEDEEDDKKDNGKKDSTAGTYYFASITRGGEFYDYDAIAEEAGEEIADLYRDTYIILNGDGTGEMYQGDAVTEMEYSDDQIWPVGREDDAVDMEISGKTMTFGPDEENYYVMEKK